MHDFLDEDVKPPATLKFWDEEPPVTPPVKKRSKLSKFISGVAAVFEVGFVMALVFAVGLLLIERTSLVNTLNEMQEIASDQNQVIQNLREAQKAIPEEEEATGNAVTPNSDVAQAALSYVSNGTASVEVVDKPCGFDNEEVAACVSSSNLAEVQINSKYLGDSYESWLMIMTHEYAHIVQFGNYDELLDSDVYLKLFKADIEWFADCMAMAAYGVDYRSGYQYSCSEKQLEAGMRAWDADFS